MEITKLKKTILVSIPIIILVLISGILGIICYNKTKKIDHYFEGETISSLLSIVDKQKAINNKLENIKNNKKYTFENPYIELNPYEISPLSAIIIFQTKNNEEVNVYLNDVFMTKMEQSEEHVIPIYGLYENYDNKIKLVIGNEEKEYTIKTKKSNIEYPLEILEKSADAKVEDIYFTVASYATWLTGWDINGNLRFYLTEDFRMDVEWLENGHFIIGTSQGQFAENFVGFVEMDYLGKIYNYYTLENGFSFESQILSNGNIMSAGGKTPVYIKEQVVYELDPATGKKVSEVNFYEIFKNIDPEFPEKYLGQAAIRNGFYYNEKTGEMIVSFRGINTVFSINYNEKTMNWIFTNPNNEVFKNNVWNKYKVKSKDGFYPWGQHSPQITKDGYIAIFNNGYDRYNGFEAGGEDQVIKYKDNYSRAEIYKIENMKAKRIWKYDLNKKYLSHQYGSVKVYDDNSKLIDFGYILKDNYRKDINAKLSVSEQNPDNIYALIYHLDESDNIILKAKCEEGKYRSFINTLYKNITSNVTLKELNIFNTIPNDKVDESNIKTLNVENTTDWIYSLDFTKNTFKTNYSIHESDELKFHFVNKTGKVYTFTYKEKNNTQLNRIFNIELNNGKYAIYISLNGTLYNTKLNVEF